MLINTPIKEFIPYPDLIIPTRNTQIEDPLLKKYDHFIGMELEIENIKNCPCLDYYWDSKSDGSLRNYGIEFVSKPLPAFLTTEALTYLKRQIYYNENIPKFSYRCSTHIHLNVRDLTVTQIKILLLLYAIFEKHFFTLAGTKREENIFCVPLYKSTQLMYYNTLPDSFNKWSKYNAFNISPVFGNNDSPCYGTIEFRHLYGTLDIDIISSWIKNIILLYNACLTEKLEDLEQRIMTMNSTSEYILLYKKIFKELAKPFIISKLDFESCITNTKLSLSHNNYTNYYKAGSLYQKTKYPMKQTTTKQTNWNNIYPTLSFTNNI